MSLFAENRRRLCEKLREGEGVPSGAVVVLQGGEQQCLHSSDTEVVFRQVCMYVPTEEGSTPSSMHVSII